MKFASYIEIILGAGIVYFVPNKVGHMLGYLLIFIGLSYVILNEEIRFDIDQKNKLIHWYKKKLFRKKTKIVPFSEVKSIFVQRIGKSSTFTEFYVVTIELRSGDLIQTQERYTKEADAQRAQEQLISNLA